MSEFTILRFNECNNTLLQGIRRQKQWLFLWGAAVLLLFWNLGTGAFSAAECIPAAAAQDLMDSSSTPQTFLNRLVWFFSISPGGVSEMSARMPVAIGALLMLGGVLAIAHKLAGRGTAIASGWICLTTVGFLVNGRMVTDQMTLAAIVLWSTAIYLFSREKFSYCSAILFWFLLSFGLYTGGFFALVPAVIMILDLIFRKQIRNLFTLRNITGFLIGIASYVLLYHYGDFRCENSGISLHVDLGQILKMSLPWTPLFVLAFLDIAKRKKQNMDHRLLFYCVLIAALCTVMLKNAVLPLLGFSAILCGVMLTSSPVTVPQLFSRILFRLVDALLPLLALTLLLTPVLFIWRGPRFLPAGMAYPNWFVGMFYFGAPIAGILIFVWQTVMIRRRKQKKAMPEICGADPVPDRVIPVAAFLLLILFAILLPGMRSDAAFYSEKPFLLQTKDLLRNQYGMKSPQRIYLLPGDAVSRCKTYLRCDNDVVLPVHNADNIASALDDLKKHGGALFGLRRDFMRYRIPLTGLVLTEPPTVFRSAPDAEDRLAVLLFLK